MPTPAEIEFLNKERGFSPDHDAYLNAAEADPALAMIDPRMSNTTLIPRGSRYGDIGLGGQKANEDQTVLIQRPDRTWLKVEMHKLTKEDRDAVNAEFGAQAASPVTTQAIYEKYAERIRAREQAANQPVAVKETQPVEDSDVNKFFDQVSRRQPTSESSNSPAAWTPTPSPSFNPPKKRALFRSAGWTMRGAYDDIIVSEFAVILVFSQVDSQMVFLPVVDEGQEAYDFALKVDGVDREFVLNSSSVQFDYAGKTFVVFPILS